MRSQRSSSDMSDDTREAQWLLQEKYKGEESVEFFADLKRLEAGEPLAYLIGNIPFLGVQIDLSKRPLIPRPETEYWVEQTFKHIQEPVAFKALELFAGSGAIGAALLKRFPNAHVDFGEIDPELHQGILSTLAENKLEGRSHIFQTDVWSGIPADARYRYVFANPPYLSEMRTKHIGPSVLSHEPHKALFADSDGMALITTCIQKAPEHLSSDGTVYIEHDDWQAESVRALFNATGFFDIVTYMDQYEVPRMTQASFRAV